LQPLHDNFDSNILVFAQNDELMYWQLAYHLLDYREEKHFSLFNQIPNIPVYFCFGFWISKSKLFHFRILE
jgi:hypothetical protein